MIPAVVHRAHNLFGLDKRQNGRSLDFWCGLDGFQRTICIIVGFDEDLRSRPYFVDKAVPAIDTAGKGNVM